MASITIDDAAGRVEELAEGIGTPTNVDDDNDNDNDGDGGGGGGGGPTYESKVPTIDMAQPVHGEVTGDASKGVVITALGNADPGVGKYKIERVEVRFGNSGSYQKASLDPNNGWLWSLASQPLKTSGSVGVSARIIAKDDKGNRLEPEPQDGCTVKVKLTDDIPPARPTITAPQNGTVITPDANHEFWVTLEATADDASGVSHIKYVRTGYTSWVLMDHKPLTKTWTARFKVSFDANPQPLQVQAFDIHGNDSQVALVNVRTADTIRPKVTIAGDDEISLPDRGDGTAILPQLSGNASDSMSKVAKIEWALNPNPDSPAFAPVQQPTPQSPPRSSTAWSVKNIPIPGGVSGGVNQIWVRATDSAGNKSDIKQVLIEVTPTYPPKDPTVGEYFSTLVDFIVRRFIQGGAPLTVERLGEVLGQPFAALLGSEATTDTTGAQQQVPQLRLSLEVLRTYFDKIAKSTGLDAALLAKIAAGRAAAESTYRQRAYESILRSLGTSVEEVRATLRTGEANQQALAERLGIELRGLPGSPSNLQELFLTPNQLSEARLERLFGLADFARNPLEPPAPDPELLTMRLQRLERSWREQDQAGSSVIVDPDVITADDLQPGPQAATRLLQKRQGWLDGLLSALRSYGTAVPDSAPGPKPPPPSPTPGPKPPPIDEDPGPLPPAEEVLVADTADTADLAAVPMDPLNRFDQIVAGVLGVTPTLRALATKQQSGENIQPELDQLHLPRPAFDRLVTIRALVTTNLMTDADWEEVYAILIQVQKLRVAADWRTQEQGAAVSLGPTFFRPGGVSRAGPALSPWRTVPGARRRWLTTLRGRTEQRVAMRQGLGSALAAAEDEALPVLRDNLISALAPLSVLPATPDALTKYLFTDVMASAALRVTRVEHAIQILQSLLVAVRTGSANGWARKQNTESQEKFDEELRWMGSYANWYAAMQVFLYPENLMYPALRLNQSTPFKTVIKNLRRERQLAPDRAQEIATDFAPKDSVGNPLDPITLARTTGELKALRDKIRGDFGSAVLSTIPRSIRERYYDVPLAIALQLHKAGQYLAALDWFRMVYAYDLPWEERKTYYGLTLEREPKPDQPRPFRRKLLWLQDSLNPHEIVRVSYQDLGTARYDVHTRFAVMSLVRCLLDFADTEFVQDTNESLPRARTLYLQALDLLSSPELNPVKVPGLTPNDTVTGLRRRAQVALAKVRTGRNFAGLTRQIEAVRPVDTAAGFSPLVASSGPFGSTSLRTFQPTPYAYTTLVERAKQLVSVAQQVEQSYLAAIEKRDTEAYSRFTANQDLALANANVQLQTLRVTEAASGVTLAGRQRERADYQVQEYQKLLDKPETDSERALRDDYSDALMARNRIAIVDAALTASQAIQSAWSLESLTTGQGVMAGVVSMLAGVKGGLTIDLNNIETDIQRHSLSASIENRIREWRLQQGLAQKDIAIADQQIQLARDHEAIVVQEGVIAQMQFAQAQATVAFLAEKFTNVELYDWMIDVLQDVYSYFLRQATAVAQLAQSQLAFESQETVPLLIRRDYWQPAQESALDGAPVADRRGLTGSARLLQDIYELDQFAFETKKRKLQLTKTFSLARVAPVEFQDFRRTGVLTFATPMALFDQDFPGHYLRLIKRVRTSVVALVPPNQGIRATLTNAGVSRVVIGGDSFQTVRLTRGPESVALTSPSNATGVFELDAQPELLLPFELSGVDSIWNLELPKAANAFDFRTIADVLVTFEYTALSSNDYRYRVIQQLDRSVLASRSYSIRDQFPDQWYDLHNPQQPAVPLAVDIAILPDDFPTNVDSITSAHLALYVVFADDNGHTPVRTALTFTPTGPGQPRISGDATSTTDGIISTRIGNAAAWVPMLNQSPYGTWQLAFPENAKMRNLLDNEAIADLAFVVTYSGQTPEWPD